MSGTREKLIELIASEVCDTYSEACEEWLPHDCGKCYANNCHIAEIADHLIANGVVVSKMETATIATDNNVGDNTWGDGFKQGYEDGFKVGYNADKWIPVTERLPEPETEVLVLAERKSYSFRSGGVTTFHTVTTGMYEDGSKNTEDSNWCWETDGFEYDEELDAYIIPEGWWEYKHYNGDDEYNHAIDDKVTHWMPLPEPPKGE